MSEWQPIETAPENEVVLVYGTLDGWTKPNCVPAFYDWGDEAWMTTVVRADCVYVTAPTHWMPLPEPPALQSGEE